MQEAPIILIKAHNNKTTTPYNRTTRDNMSGRVEMDFVKRKMVAGYSVSIIRIVRDREQHNDNDQLEADGCWQLGRFKLDKRASWPACSTEALLQIYTDRRNPWGGDGKGSEGIRGGRSYCR